MTRGRPEGSKSKCGKKKGKKELIDIIKVDKYDIKADSRQFILIENNSRRTYHGSITSLIDSLFERKLRQQTVCDLKDLKNAVINAKKELIRQFNLSDIENSLRCNLNKED